MAIKEFITLEGVQEIEAQLKKLAATGEQSLEQFRKPLPDMKLPDIDSKPIEETTGHVVKLTEVLHTLRPILQAAGLQFSEFGALTRLAGTSLIALSAAIAGAVVVSLAKLEENAARTKGRLADLFDSSGKGGQAFAALEKQAGQFGTTVEGLAPGLEAFQTALNAVDRTAQGFRALREEDLPGAQLAKNADAVTEAYGNFIKLLRAGRLDQDQAEKSAKAFFDTMKDGGLVTSAALKNLPEGTIKALKDAFGQAGLTAKQFFALVDGGAISADNFEKALINFGPQAQRAFDTKAIKTFSEELSKTFTVLKDGFKSLTGTELSDFLNNQIKLFREGLQGFLADLKAIKDFVRSGAVAVLGEPAEKATFDQRFAAAGVDAIAAALQKLPPNFIDANNSLQKLGAAGLLAGVNAAKGIDQATASLQQMRDAAKVTGQELQDVVIGTTRFTGRLNQVQRFEPQLAGEVGPDDTAGKAAGKKFIDAVGNEIATAAPTVLAPLTKLPAFDFSDALGSFFELGGRMQDVARIVWNNIQAIFSQPFRLSAQWTSNPFLSGQPTDLATGGFVRGPGSTTSDSILAWLSNQEFVVNARAVSHYGPDLFAALNAMRLPRDFISRFSMGGLARSLGGNRFAAGGAVSTAGGNRSLTLVLDQKRFSVTGSKGTIDDLEREASLRGLAMIGKAPSWIR